MEMSGEQRIAAEQDAVWRALNDPQVIKACVPGCEAIEAKGRDEYELTVLAAVGPVRARFKGSMKLMNITPPRAYSLVFEGAGGVAGFAKGEAGVELEPEGQQTLLKYTTNAKVGGKLAQIGSRLIDSTARKMADQFFANFNELVTAPAGAASPAAAVAPPAQRPAGRGIPAWVWGDVTVLAVVLLLLLLFAR